MEFSLTGSKQGLIQDIDFLCGSNSANFPLADKTRCINVAYQNVATLIWDSDGTWNYDDSNATSLPKVTRTLGNASATYQVPTTAMRIKGVEIKSTAGTWSKLAPIDYHDLTESPEEFLGTAGTPLYYDLDGNYIRLFPLPVSTSVTLSSGMCVRISRDVTEFTSASTTGAPGFATAFHRILSVAAALDFEKDNQQRTLLLQMKDRLEKGLIKFYSKRGEELKTRIKPFGKKRWRQYL